MVRTITLKFFHFDFLSLIAESESLSLRNTFAKYAKSGMKAGAIADPASCALKRERADRKNLPDKQLRVEKCIHANSRA